MHAVPLLAALLLQACAPHRFPFSAEEPEAVEGARSATLDLVRLVPGDAKVYVQVDLGLEEPELFLLDTGASVSAIRGELVRELGLEVEQEPGSLQGLGGTMSWSSVVLPELRLGGLVLHDLRAAVDVPGVPSSVGPVPLGGILGNNAWRHFRLLVDYPGDRLQLERPAGEPPAEGEPLLFDGMHGYTLVAVTATDGERSARLELPMVVDTGAQGVVLAGPLPELAPLAREADEPIYGVGSSEELPTSSLFRHTRRLDLARVELGGVAVDEPGSATWVDFQGPARTAPRGLAGLVGYSVLGGHRLLLDYPGGRVALLEPEGPPRELDGVALLLEQERERHGDAPERGLQRARLLAWEDRLDEASQALDAYLREQPEDQEAWLFQARLARARGELGAYWRALSHLDVDALLRGGELVAAVDGHALAGRLERAQVLVDEATPGHAQDPQLAVARADLLVFQGKPGEARRVLEDSAQRLGPDAHLLRRARAAWQEGDLVGSRALLRRALLRNPLDGFALWFYLQACLEAGATEALAADLDAAMSRVYAEDRPRDFLLAAWTALGRPGAEEMLQQGLQEDCEELDEGPARDNCEAWYLGLAGQELDHALELSRRACEREPARSDFLDTQALVLWRLGRPGEALAVESSAAELSPDDLYLLWQRERYAREAGGAGPP